MHQKIYAMHAAVQEICDETIGQHTLCLCARWDRPLGPNLMVNAAVSARRSPG